MPGWDAKTKKLVEAGELSVFGVLEEQHPVRAELFAQWKELTFPMLADPLNLLDVSVVPIHLLIDGNGIIRFRNPSDLDFEKFMATDYSGGEQAMPIKGSEYREGDRLAMKGDLNAALEVYNGLSDNGGRLHFRKGVVWRMKFDSDSNPVFFQSAVSEWQKARKANGGQYIWRRRIQQYGPQSDKPYPFYDWVAEAKQSVASRGETPVELKSQLTRSELASPRGASDIELISEEPDPEGTVEVDEGDFELLPIILPSTAGEKGEYRVHLVIQPQGSFSWNNEAGPMNVWLGGGEGHVAGFTIPVNVKVATSSEVRSGEFEWVVHDSSTRSGYVVFHTCNKESGLCTILRKNFSLDIPE